MNDLASRLALATWVAVAGLVLFLVPNVASSAHSLRTVALSGQAAPGVPGGVYIGFNAPVLNDSGRTAFVARSTSIGGEGVWSEGLGSLDLVARAGNLAPGTNLSYGYFRSLVLNDAGQIAFSAGLEASGTGIWVERNGNLDLVARQGSQAASTPAGVVYTSDFLSSSVLNNAGQTAFSSRLSGSGVDATNEWGIWSEGLGSLALLIRSGNPAPDTLPGVLYTTPNPRRPFDSPVLNDSGQTVFRARLTGGDVDSTNYIGIWFGTPENLKLVTRAGNHAPGTPNGVNFADFTGNFTTPALNESGRTAFSARLTGSGVDSTNDEGIWATDHNGALQLIAREGDLLEVIPGEFRTIRSFNFIGGTGNSDGRPSGFNNLGQLAFHARFTDGSDGIFVSNLVAIPEPGGFALAIIGLLLISLTCTRK